MAGPQTNEHAEPAYSGRRRADFPDAGTTVEAIRPRDPWDAARPVDPTYPAEPTPDRDTGPIAEALGYAVDRLDLIEHKLGDLNGIIERLGYELRPVLTMDGDGIPEPMRETTPEDPSAVDRRSTVARRIAALGHRADDLASIVGYLRNKAAGIVDALELEGVAR